MPRFPKIFPYLCNMGRLYLHIPFCRKACTYCDFHFSTNLSRQAEMVAALLQELRRRAPFFREPGSLQSVYFGGGTPSVLTPTQVSLLLEEAARHYGISDEAEITLEANPDDLTPAYLQGIRAAGINRLSIGIQSFAEQDLRWMNRSHTATQAQEVVARVRSAGFTHFTLDLIFGLPGHSMADWDATLTRAMALDPPHLSVYALSVEPKTLLYQQQRRGQLHLPPDDLYEAQFLHTHERLGAAGYHHYELSSYARDGHYARHNSAYWAGEPYLGLGPAAHSYDGQQRHWNVANNYRYLFNVGEGGTGESERETLTLRDRYNEYVMTGLRTVQGITRERLEGYIADWAQYYATELAFWQHQGVLQQAEGRYWLSPAGWMLSDRVASDLFWE